MDTVSIKLTGSGSIYMGYGLFSYSDVQLLTRDIYYSSIRHVVNTLFFSEFTKALDEFTEF